MYRERVIVSSGVRAGKKTASAVGDENNSELFGAQIRRTLFYTAAIDPLFNVNTSNASPTERLIKTI